MERLGLVSAIKSRFEALAPFLDERRRRLAAASEALAVQRHRSPQHARGNRQISAPLHLECGGRKPILRKESDPKCPRARVQPEGGGRGHRACGKRLRAARPRAPIRLLPSAVAGADHSDRPRMRPAVPRVWQDPAINLGVSYNIANDHVGKRDAHDAERFERRPAPMLSSACCQLPPRA
jgi:hypothetical protein